MFSLLQAAGWPVWFLIAASLSAVALIVERALTLRRARVLPPGLLDDALALQRSGRIPAERLHAIENGSPLGKVLGCGLRHRFAPRERALAAIEQAGRGVAHGLERNLQMLGTLAAVAPLLGLFGTVVGMIEIFGAQTTAGGSPEQLGHGISVALYNTAFGLAVAIPSLIAHRGFRGRVDDLLMEMEQQSQLLLEALGEPVPRASAGAVTPGTGSSPTLPTAPARGTEGGRR